MKNILKIALFAIAMLLMVSSYLLLPQSWFSVAADQGPYPPPEGESVPAPTAQAYKYETFTPQLISVEAEMELRKSIGFRSDYEYAVAVRSSETAVIDDRFGRAAFTPDEASEFEIRLKLEDDGGRLMNSFNTEPDLREAFGGIYLEHAAGSENETAGGKLVLQIVYNHSLANDIPAMLPTLQYPERLQIALVDFSSERLMQQYRKISNAASQHSEIQAVSIDHRKNRVYVVIAPSDAQTTLDGIVDKASLPNDLAILVVDPSVIVQEGKIKKIVEAVKGGDSWGQNSGGSNCTLGFKVRDGDTYSMLTAGHCIEELNMSAGDPIYHATTQIGAYSGTYKWGSPVSWGWGFDAAILYMNDFMTAYDDVNHYNYSRDIVGSTSEYVTGYWRCFTGKNSGTQCGIINCTDSTYFDIGNGRWNIDMFTIDPDSVEGDSGAPAYRPETDFRASVTGILSGRIESGLPCTNGVDSDFSKWSIIRDYWNLTLATDTEIYLPVIVR